MDNVLLFHIGQHKTGTTSIQNALFNNETLLNEYGWTYPHLRHDVKFPVGNGQNISECFISNGNKAKIKRDWDIISDSIKENNVIISAEGFSSTKCDFIDVLREAKKITSNIKVIIYIRRFDELKESLYLQCVKRYKEHGTIEDFESFVWNDQAVLDNLDKISKEIGKENLIVRIYDVNRFKNRNVVYDFLSTIIPTLVCDCVNEGKMEDKNPSLSRETLEIKKVFNEVFDEFNADNDDYLFESSLLFMDIENVAIKNGWKRKRADDVIPYSEKHKLYEDTREIRKTIRGEYIDGFFEELYKEPQLTVTDEIPLSDSEKRIVALMARYIQITQIKEKYLPIKTIVNFLKNGRKVILWGAGKIGEELIIYSDINIEFVIDKDEKKIGNHLHARNIVAPSNDLSSKEYFVIIAVYRSAEIVENLEKLNFRRNEDYICISDYF